MEPQLKEYTALEVAKHTSPKDIWMILHGGVYDLSKFINEHPGGEEVLLKLAGHDGTECFEEMGHTREAIKLRETLKIGVLKAGEKIEPEYVFEKQNPSSGEEDTWDYQPPLEKSHDLMYQCGAALIVVYGLIYYFFF